MIDTLLVLNAGSSSLKFQVFDAHTLDVLMRGKVVRIGEAAQLNATLPSGARVKTDLTPGADHHAALSAVINLIHAHDGNWHVSAVAHRIVHGGPDYTAPVIITDEVMMHLEKLVPLAPLHQPHNLAAIKASAAIAGHAPDIACFDTAFHAAHTPLFTRFAIADHLHNQGVRRYGFHGLSYAWIANMLKEKHPHLYQGRVIAAHLGNGASLCAMKNGASIDTTMGMTALDGLPMGTRVGAFDAGAVIYMLRHLGLSITEIEHALYNESGLKGLSGLSNDVETLLRSPDPRAAFALDYFALKVSQFAAALTASLGGCDGLVFTGGIGEHAESVRSAIVQRLSFLTPFEVLVIPANEERQMALEARRLLQTV
jgi:acetate kinase